MEEEGAIINGEELNSDIGDLKAEKKEKLKRQLLIGIGICVGLIFLIFLIIYISIHKNDDNEKPKNEVFAEFECIYDVKTISQTTTILGNDFDNSFKFSIFVGDDEIKYSKNYKFN